METKYLKKPDDFEKKYEELIKPIDILNKNIDKIKKNKCSICKQEGHNKRSCKMMNTPILKPKTETKTNIIEKKPVNMEPNINIQKTKNSLVAITGNFVEDLLCKSSDILERLGTQYFKKMIVSCVKLNKKKSDHLLSFEDVTQTTIQLKNGDGGGRGWSFDRRSLTNLPTNDLMKELIKVVCLRTGEERNTVLNDKTLITRLLLGDEETTKPQHFVHTTMKNNKIISLSICPTSIFIEEIIKNAYENCNPKKTCVHLTPLIYLQRKGGGKSDHSPDDIQAKLRCMPKCMTQITLD